MPKPRKRRHRSTGTVPGTLTVDPDAAPPVIRVMAYGPDGHVEQTLDGPGAIRPFLKAWPVTWVNVDGLGDAATIAAIGEIFSLHPLALEDIVNTHQRAKVETYGEHLFIVSRMGSLADRVETEQVSLFLGPGFVLTFQERSGDCLDPVRERIRKGLGRIGKAGPDYLAYSLLDAVIDGYFPLLEALGERLESLEEQVIARPDTAVIGRIHTAKRDLLVLRRATWPLREAVAALVREDVALIAEPTRVYFRDAYDHVIQVIDMVETYRELASGLLDAYQSSLSNRMNAVMKVLTIIATIFIPLGFLAGVWGMNFNTQASPYNMPLLNWAYGYPLAITLMTTIGVGMLALFWRKGWLGSPGQPAPRGPDDPHDPA